MKTTANKRFWWGMLVMALAFGMTVAGCDDGSTGGGTDSDLNGTWVYSDGYEMKFNNGSYEQSIDGIVVMKGTYTTSDGKITVQITHVNGSLYAEGAYGLDSKLYSKNELETALEAIYKEDLKKSGFLTDAQIAEILAEELPKMLNSAFSSQTSNYSVKGNTLIIDDDVIFTRK